MKRISSYLFASALLLLAACGSPVEEQISEDPAEPEPEATSSPAIQPTWTPTLFAIATPNEMAVAEPTQSPTETSVQVTLEPLDMNTPQAEDIGPVSPVWLEDENIVSEGSTLATR